MNLRFRVAEMNNPWLNVSLADYEGHMALPGIEQAQLLSDIFADVLARFSPCSVAVVGCAGGNGFDRIPPAILRVVGVDLNPHFVAETEARFGDRIENLELMVGDIQSHKVRFAPVDLIFLGLILDYVNAESVLNHRPGESQPLSEAALSPGLQPRVHGGRGRNGLGLRALDRWRPAGHSLSTRRARRASR